MRYFGRGLIRGLLVALILSATFVEARHRGYGKSGTASAANTPITIPFNPSALCVTNSGTANELYFDYTDGVAAAVDASTNFLVPPGATVCVGWNDSNVTNTFSVGVICSAAETTLYNIHASQK